MLGDSMVITIFTFYRASLDMLIPRKNKLRKKWCYLFLRHN